MQGLESLALPEKIAALAELLSLPNHLQKSA
jgi:hypothetical protein